MHIPITLSNIFIYSIFISDAAAILFTVCKIAAANEITAVSNITPQAIESISEISPLCFFIATAEIADTIATAAIVIIFILYS